MNNSFPVESWGTGGQLDGASTEAGTAGPSGDPAVPMPMPMPDPVPASLPVPVSPDRSVPGVVETDPLPVIAEVTTAEADALQLTPAQRTVIALLIAGRTRADAATAAGIGRTTLWRWFNDDPAFIAAFNSWQNDVRTTVQSQLLAASHEAAAVVLNAIRRGDSRLAWKLLESQGMTLPRTAGPTDADAVRAETAVQRKKQQIADRQRRRQMEIDEIDAAMPPI